MLLLRLALKLFLLSWGILPASADPSEEIPLTDEEHLTCEKNPCDGFIAPCDLQDSRSALSKLTRTEPRKALGPSRIGQTLRNWGDIFEDELDLYRSQGYCLIPPRQVSEQKGALKMCLYLFTKKQPCSS